MRQGLAILPPLHDDNGIMLPTCYNNLINFTKSNNPTKQAGIMEYDKLLRKLVWILDSHVTPKTMFVSPQALSEKISV